MSLIFAEGLTKIYPRGSEEIHALRGVSLSVEHGEFISIVGPSGWEIRAHEPSWMP